VRHPQYVQVIDLVDRLPVILGGVLERRVELDVMTDVVHQHVEMPVLREHLVLQRPERRRIAHIEHKAFATPARPIDLVDDHRSAALAVVDDDHVRAVAGEESRGRGADRSRTAVISATRSVRRRPGRRCSRPWAGNYLSVLAAWGSRSRRPEPRWGPIVTGVALRSIDDEQWRAVEEAWHNTACWSSPDSTSRTTSKSSSAPRRFARAAGRSRTPRRGASTSPASPT
jgi:hypothetical protein